MSDSATFNYLSSLIPELLDHAVSMGAELADRDADELVSLLKKNEDILEAYSADQIYTHAASWIAAQ